MMAATLSLIFEEQQNHHHRGLFCISNQLGLQSKLVEKGCLSKSIQDKLERRGIQFINLIMSRRNICLLSLKRMVTRTITWHSMNLRVIINKEFRFYEQPFDSIWA
jgi:hypothetical protein